MRVIKILVVIFLILITYLGYGETAKLFYTNESATYLTELSSINIIISIVSILIFVFIIFYKFSNRAFKISLSFFVLLLWLLSGIKVGVKKFEDGRVNYGVYCFETNRFFLCEKEDLECESIIANRTSVEGMSFWRVKIKNEDIEEIIFVGPITWSKAIEVLKTNIGNGTSTE
jgi:hypothetical protein